MAEYGRSDFSEWGKGGLRWLCSYSAFFMENGECGMRVLLWWMGMADYGKSDFSECVNGGLRW